MIGEGEQLRKHGLPNQTTVPATSAELLLLCFCARNTQVVKEVAEDKLNISLFPLKTALKVQYSTKIEMSCFKIYVQLQKTADELACSTEGCTAASQTT